MKRVLLSIGLLAALGLPQRALAQFTDVSPTMLDLVLAAGEMTTETVSLTINPPPGLTFVSVRLDARGSQGRR